MFTGILHEDSGSLFGILKRLLSQNELDKVSKSYEIAYKLGAANEQREEGLSYNPRPARIAEILIKEAKIKSPTVISASFFAPLYNIDLSNDISVGKDTSHFIEEVQSFYKTKKELQTTIGKQISLAFMIDTIRRLHILTVSMEEERNIYEIAGYLLKFESNEALKRLQTVLGSHPNFVSLE